MTFSFTQPICDNCYKKLYPDRKAAFPPEPLRINPTIEICCMCGVANNDSIYIRIDPSTVLFAKHENKEKLSNEDN